MPHRFFRSNVELPGMVSPARGLRARMRWLGRIVQREYHAILRSAHGNYLLEFFAFVVALLALLYDGMVFIPFAAWTMLLDVLDLALQIRSSNAQSDRDDAQKKFNNPNGKIDCLVMSLALDAFRVNYYIYCSYGIITEYPRNLNVHWDILLCKHSYDSFQEFRLMHEKQFNILATESEIPKELTGQHRLITAYEILRVHLGQEAASKYGAPALSTKRQRAEGQPPNELDDNLSIPMAVLNLLLTAFPYQEAIKLTKEYMIEKASFRKDRDYLLRDLDDSRRRMIEKVESDAKSIWNTFIEARSIVIKGKAGTRQVYLTQMGSRRQIQEQYEEALKKLNDEYRVMVDERMKKNIRDGKIKPDIKKPE
ncbi:hypothetical protein PT974_10758 [Cladobotryum mycophilum]|uniref:Uncharacterized protein n=1 Tax=Cladobotryum mycophilum TaxID=491253 RepID=A0ABR0SBQ5_9HYPO